MPYIIQKRRNEMRREPGMNVAGELNYEITVKINKYLCHHGLTYQTINDIVGALEGAKAEFQRRVAAPYEDSKIIANGDVYDLEFIGGAHDA